MPLINKEESAFWKQAIKKGFVTVGFTFFSILTTIGLKSAIVPSIIAGGSYIFVEAMKYYQLQPDKKVLTKSQTKLYTFLI